MRKVQGGELPGAIPFACTLNAVRSPMAASIMRHLFGKFVRVESAGVRAGALDPFAAEVMDEIGIALAQHKPMRFEDVEASTFDLVVTLSPEAQHRAVEMTRASAAIVEYWPTMDPTVLEGSRAQSLANYRAVRDVLPARIRERFGAARASDT
jgi:protein-tyrosine-phosphatase